jgi:hypothetical protein
MIKTLARDADTMQALLAAIVHSSDDAIISTTTDGAINYWKFSKRGYR